MKQFMMMAGLTLVLAGCQEDAVYLDDGLIEVKAITVSTASETAVQRYPAVTDATDLTELAFRIDGELKSLPVKPGAHVKQGQLLAQLETHNLELEVADQKAKYELNVSQYQRAKALFSQGAMPASQHDQLKAQLDVAKATLELAKQQLSYAQIRAPFDGTIARVGPKNFEKVSAGQPVLVMHRSDRIDLMVQVPESIMAAGSSEDEGPLEFQVHFVQAPELSFTAAYKDHTTELDPRTSSYLVSLEMPMPEAFQLLQGMPAWVDFNFDELHNTGSIPVIPTQAVVNKPGDRLEDNLYYVWTIDDQQKVERVSVTLGDLRQNGVQVTSGLSAGQRIVLAGQYQLAPGMKVTVVDGAEK